MSPPSRALRPPPEMRRTHEHEQGQSERKSKKPGPPRQRHDDECRGGEAGDLRPERRDRHDPDAPGIAARRPSRLSIAHRGAAERPQRREHRAEQGERRDDECLRRDGDDAISKPTAANESQKPACVSAHGSRAVTTTADASSTSNHGQRTPALLQQRHRGKQANIVTCRLLIDIRCATPVLRKRSQWSRSIALWSPTASAASTPAARRSATLA